MYFIQYINTNENNIFCEYVMEIIRRNPSAKIISNKKSVYTHTHTHTNIFLVYCMSHIIHRNI